MSECSGDASSITEESNVGPIGRATYPDRSTSPECSESPATSNHVDQGGQTETEGHTDAQEEPGSDSSSLSEFVSHVDRDINTQQPPVYSEHDDVPEYDNIHQAGALPQVLTYTGVLADLNTVMHEFDNWDDYKLICLAGPKITLVFEEGEARIELVCSRKLLKDFSATFAMMDLMAVHDVLYISGLLVDVPVRSAPRTFIQLYEMMQAGGLPLHVSGEISLLRLVELHTMADFLTMPLIKTWIDTYTKAKMRELAASWSRDYGVALLFEGVPGAQRRTASRFPILHMSPLQLQAARLLDIQDAYLHVRTNPSVKVVLPSQLARLASDWCPVELRFRVQAAGQLCDDFLRDLSIRDLKRRAEARRGVTIGRRQ